MNKLIIFIFIILTFSFYSCASLIGALDAANKSLHADDERYGRKTTNTMLENPDKASDLGYYFTRINQLYKKGKITSTEKTKREKAVEKAYDDWKKGYISEYTFREKVNKLSKQ